MVALWLIIAALGFIAQTWAALADKWDPIPRPIPWHRFAIVLLGWLLWPLWIALACAAPFVLAAYLAYLKWIDK